MHTQNAHLAADCRCILGEGPVWWQDALWFVDIEGGRLHRLRPGKAVETVFEDRSRIGFAWPAVDGGWLIARDASLAQCVPNESGAAHRLEVEPPGDGTRLNDGACDPTGRLYAGTMHLETDSGRGALYRFEQRSADGWHAERIIAGVTISNGLAWNAETGTMYYIDTPTRRIDAFDWDRDTGAIRNRRRVAELRNGVPDGMAIDREGLLWVAMWGGSRVARVDPVTGREIGAVQLPCSHVTSCSFGGEAFDQLWITSARAGLSDGELDSEPLAGGVFVADVDAVGLPTVPARMSL